MSWPLFPNKLTLRFDKETWIRKNQRLCKNWVLSVSRVYCFRLRVINTIRLIQRRAHCRRSPTRTPLRSPWRWSPTRGNSKMQKKPTNPRSSTNPRSATTRWSWWQSGKARRRDSRWTESTSSSRKTSHFTGNTSRAGRTPSGTIWASINASLKCRDITTTLGRATTGCWTPRAMMCLSGEPRGNSGGARRLPEGNWRLSEDFGFPHWDWE